MRLALRVDFDDGDHLRGQGINHIARCGFDIKPWLGADVVLDPTGEIEAVMGKPTPREMDQGGSASVLPS